MDAAFFIPCLQSVSLANAKATEHAIENVVGVDCSDDLTQLIERGFQFGGDQLVPRLVLCQRQSASQAFAAHSQAVAAADGGGPDGFAAIVGIGGDERCNLFFQSLDAPPVQTTGYQIADFFRIPFRFR